jgi:hypothetical protein
MQKMKKDTIYEVLLHVREEAEEEYVLVDHDTSGSMLLMPDDTILYRKEGFDLEDVENCSWLRINANHEGFDLSDAKFYEVKSNETATHLLLSDLEFIQ